MRLQIYVLPPNTPPTAIAIDDISVDANAPVFIPLSGIFSDPGDFLTVAPTYPDWLTFIYQGSSFMVFVGTAPAAGDYPITLTATDTRGQSVTTSFTVHVIIANVPPVANADSATVSEDSLANVIDVLANDTDPNGDKLFVTAVNPASHGTASLEGGVVKYTPAANYNGSDSFTYTISDGSLTATGSVSVTVTEVNDAPTAGADIATVAEDSLSNVIAVLSNDSPGPMNESAQTLTVTFASALHGAVTINGDGTLSYSPAAGYYGPDTISYTIQDDGTTNGVADPRTAAGSVSVTVNQTNNQPPPASIGPGCHGPALIIYGTDVGDKIRVVPQGMTDVKVLLNDADEGTFSLASFVEIIVYGRGGDDNIEIVAAITQEAFLFGEAGNDRLKGANGPNVLVGGDGDDELLGSQGRDVLIGGRGSDRLVGYQGDDVLIAGWTDHDNSFAALCAILDEWSRTDLVPDLAYTQRINHLSLGGGLNGSFRLNDATVHDDNNADKLTGSAGVDWFFANLDELDKITDAKPGETTTDVD